MSIVTEIERRLSAMHASAPDGHECSDCMIDKEPCPTCYTAWWQQGHPNVREISVVTEIPVGKYDAVRTLRMCLQMAEQGELNRAMVVVQNVPDGEVEGTAEAPEVFYSEMPRWEALWLSRFLNSFTDHRFFGQFHEDDE